MPSRVSAATVQIAKESGVSIATVSRVINGTANVSPKTKQRVNEVIKKYRYTPNAFARGLINRQSMTIGIIMPDITNPYFSAMFREFEAAARAANYSVFLCNTAFFSSADIATPPPELEYFRMMLDKKVDGVLIVGGQVDLLKIDPEYKAALQHLASNVPTVVLGQQIPDIDCLFIQRESGRGVSFAIDYLAALGHKHIAFVGGENGVDITESRLSAYWDALDALRLPKDRNLVAISDYYTKDGYNAMRELLSRGCEFTAALTVNDSVAFGAYRALADVGLRVPEDISIISCDQFFSADYYVPRLTSINQHNEHFGRFVINALLGIINGIKENVRVVMTPELVLRESCAPPLSRKAKPVQTE